jgi:hypothetical protein
VSVRAAFDPGEFPAHHRPPDHTSPVLHLLFLLPLPGRLGRGFDSLQQCALRAQSGGGVNRGGSRSIRRGSRGVWGVGWQGKREEGGNVQPRRRREEEEGGGGGRRRCGNSRGWWAVDEHIARGHSEAFAVQTLEHAEA